MDTKIRGIVPLEKEVVQHRTEVGLLCIMDKVYINQLTMASLGQNLIPQANNMNGIRRLTM